MIGLVFAGQVHDASIDLGNTAWQNIKNLAEQGRKYQERHGLKENPVNLDEWKKTTGNISVYDDFSLTSKDKTVKHVSYFIHHTNENQYSIWGMQNTVLKKAVIKNSDQNVLKVARTWHNIAMVKYNLDLIWLKNSFLVFVAGAGLFAGVNAAKSAGYSKDLVNPMSTLGKTLGCCGLGSLLLSSRGKYSKFNYNSTSKTGVVIEQDQAGM